MTDLLSSKGLPIFFFFPSSSFPIVYGQGGHLSEPYVFITTTKKFSLGLFPSIFSGPEQPTGPALTSATSVRARVAAGCAPQTGRGTGRTRTRGGGICWTMRARGGPHGTTTVRATPAGEVCRGIEAWGLVGARRLESEGPSTLMSARGGAGREPNHRGARTSDVDG